MHKRLGPRVQHSSKIILIKMIIEPKPTVIVNMYIPTRQHLDDKVEGTYEETEEEI